MSAPELFFSHIDRLGPKRHQQSQVLTGLRRSLRELDVEGLSAFQRSFDAVLDSLYRPELWGAANLILGPIQPWSFDGFLAWIAVQGEHACQRVLRNPDSALELLTRKGKGRRRARFDDVLELAADLCWERFDVDLLERLGPRRQPSLLGSTAIEPDQLWPHPATLEERLPVLWEAFAGRGIRLFPQVLDTHDVCACCGRVHAYAFGLISEGGEPLGSYTLHWVEGEWDLLSCMIQLSEEEVHFGFDHELRGHAPTLLSIPSGDAPYEPNHGTYIEPEQAGAHPLFPLARELAQLVLLVDPMAQMFHTLWQRRLEQTPALRERLGNLRGRQVGGVPCADCGQVHAETELACAMPDEVLQLTAWELRCRASGQGGELLLDGRRRFRRGVVPVPVRDRSEPYCYGVWIEQLDPTAGTDVLDSRGKRERLMRGARGLIANDLLFFPETTLGLEARIEPGPEGEFPRFHFDEKERSPLAREQLKGMPARRPQQLMRLFHR